RRSRRGSNGSLDRVSTGETEGWKNCSARERACRARREWSILSLDSDALQLPTGSSASSAQFEDVSELEGDRGRTRGLPQDWFCTHRGAKGERTIARQCGNAEEARRQRSPDHEERTARA